MRGGSLTYTLTVANEGTVPATNLVLSDTLPLNATYGGVGGIKSFLLNQSRIAGIGNVYIHDPLFKARIHPLRPISSLSDGEIQSLWGAIRETLKESIDHGGSAWEQDLYGEKGRWDQSFFLVAYREGQPCPVCGTAVEKIKTGSTSGFICPNCQPLG